MYAQLSDADKLKVDKPKILSKLEKLALAQITINYKLITAAKTVTQEKKSGTTAGARITAFLETTDGELSTSDFQEISDYFYSYFQRKLKASGIDTVAWSTIASTDFYKNATDKDDEGKDDKNEKGGNTWITNTAHNGNILHGKSELGFAFGKIKKGATFCEEIGAPAGFFYLTVDFADVKVDLDISVKRDENMYYSKTTTKKTYSWGVDPTLLSVGQPEKGLTLFWNKKSQGEILFQHQDMETKFKYHDAMSEDPSKARSGLAKQFAFRKELTPFVIETTKAKYKEAAKKALEKYADAFVAKTQGLKKD